MRAEEMDELKKEVLKIEEETAESVRQLRELRDRKRNEKESV